MVFTQETEVPPEPELGPGWRKVETKVDNRVVKTRSKYWNPEGEEVTYKEVKKLCDLKKAGGGQEVKKRKCGPRLSAELESPPKKTHLVLKEKRASMVTKEKADAMVARDKSSKKVRKCEKHQVVFKSREEEMMHMKEFHKERSTLDQNSSTAQSHAVHKVEKKKKRDSVSDDILAEDTRPLKQSGETSTPQVMQQNEVQAKYSHLVVTVVPPAPPPRPSVPGPSSRDTKSIQSRQPLSVLGSSSRDSESRLPPPGPPRPSTARATPPGPVGLATIRCDLCEYTAKSRKRLKKHMDSHIIKPEVKGMGVEEELGNLSIDGVFESFSGDDMNDDLNTARVVDVEDEFDDVEEVGMLFSRRRSIAEHNSYNGSEDEGDDEVEVDRRSPEEITLASEPEEEPEEITLDEGDEEGGELEVPLKVKDKVKEEEEELAKLEEMDDLLGKSEFVEQMMESGGMLAKFTSNCWFAQPLLWTPSKQEVWHGTVSQIEDHYGVRHLGVKVEGVKNQQEFLEVVRPLLVEHNQVNWGPALYRLAKALWFRYLDPEIPQALDEGANEEEEDEYDEYDENLYEEYEDAARDRAASDARRREAVYEEDYFEESVVPGPSQAAGEYVYEADGRNQSGGDYMYEADEEGEDWDGAEEEGDYEDYGEVIQEYEGVYQGEYFDGVNQGGYSDGVNQAEYYAGGSSYEGASNLYEDVY